MAHRYGSVFNLRTPSPWGCKNPGHILQNSELGVVVLHGDLGEHGDHEGGIALL